jgi:hypothetical protein
MKIKDNFLKKRNTHGSDRKERIKRRARPIIPTNRLYRSKSIEGVIQ